MHEQIRISGMAYALPGLNRKGCFMKLRAPDLIDIVTKEQTVRTSPDAAVLEDARVRVLPEGDCLKVTLTAEKTAVKYVRLFWKFAAEEHRSEPIKVLGDCWERGYGELQWEGILPHKRYPWTVSVSNGSDSSRELSGRFTECFGVKARPGSLCAWQYEQRGITLTCDTRCGGEGVLLSGRTLEVCRVRMGEYRDCSAFSALKAFYGTLCDDPIFPSEPVYGSNNWYYAYGVSSRKMILEDADLIARLTEGYKNRPFMVIDAGWNIASMSGPWNGNNPDYGDMKTLCEEIAAKDVKPGIWVRYLSDEAGLMKEIPDRWRLARNRRYLDPSHPDVIGMIRSVTDRLSREWGYRLIKHDFSCFDIFGDWGFNRPVTLTDDGWSFYDKGRTSAEIAENMYRVIYESAAPGTVIIGCNVPGFLTAGYCHINRAGDDTSGYEWERTRRMGVNTVAFRNMYDGTFYKADCDCVGILKNIPWSLNRRWADLVSASGTPLFFSIKPDVPAQTDLEDIRKELYRGSLQTDTAVPLDWMETSCPELWLINGTETRIDWCEN